MASRVQPRRQLPWTLFFMTCELYQRADDNEKTIRSRLAVYDESTRPLIDYYKASGTYVEINGNQPMDKVFDDIKQALKKANA